MSRIGAVPALLAGLTLSACYEAHGTRVELRTPGAQRDCTETADQVFAKEGFTSYTNVYGVNRFYSPRAPGELAFGWGIAVKIDGGSASNRAGPCTFELEALSPDEGCGMQCPLTPAPGGQLKEVTLKMARLLDEACGGKRPPE